MFFKGVGRGRGRGGGDCCVVDMVRNCITGGWMGVGVGVNEVYLCS